MASVIEELWIYYNKTNGLLRILFAISFLIIALTLLGIVWLKFVDPARFAALLDTVIDQGPKFASLIVGVVSATLVTQTFRSVIVGLQRESKEYARKLSRSDSGSSITASVAGVVVTGRIGNSRLKNTIRELREEIATLRETPVSIDVSNPDKLFQVSRQRLLDEAIRIDSISRRNLILGILFSIIALAVLAWPLITAAFQSANADEKFNVVTWAAQYYW